MLHKTKHLNQDNIHHVHFIGVGGVSMSGLAEILLDMGYAVSGSDMKSSALTKRLQTLGITFYEGHAPQNVNDADLVVYTAAVKSDNPELVSAKTKNIPTIERAVLLGEVMDYYDFSIAVCGTHGKTTTTSMVSMMMLEAQKNPTIHIGGELKAIAGNTKVGGKEYFITEACEYVESFLQFYPDLSIILNIEADHLDYFKDLSHIQSSFVKFLNQTSENGWVVANADDKNITDILSQVRPKIVTYSLLENADYTAKNIEFSEKGFPSFSLLYQGQELTRIELSVLGMHNVSNALAASAACHIVGCSPQAIADGLRKFTGTGRRFELKGERNQIQVVDDYAHHPSEVKATLTAAKKGSFNHIWCVFQPHTYTRTKALLDEFSTAFSDATNVIVTDIYAAREKDPGDVHSKMLVEKLENHHRNVKYIGEFDKIVEYLKANARPGDLILTMGAGNIDTVAEMYLSDSQ